MTILLLHMLYNFIFKNESLEIFQFMYYISHFFFIS